MNRKEQRMIDAVAQSLADVTICALSQAAQLMSTSNTQQRNDPVLRPEKRDLLLSIRGLVQTWAGVGWPKLPGTASAHRVPRVVAMRAEPAAA